jgi:hypothetical protein
VASKLQLTIFELHKDLWYTLFQIAYKIITNHTVHHLLFFHNIYGQTIQSLQSTLEILEASGKHSEFSQSSVPILFTTLTQSSQSPCVVSQTSNTPAPIGRESSLTLAPLLVEHHASATCTRHSPCRATTLRVQGVFPVLRYALCADAYLRRYAYHIHRIPVLGETVEWCGMRNISKVCRRKQIRVSIGRILSFLRPMGQSWKLESKVLEIKEGAQVHQAASLASLWVQFHDIGYKIMLDKTVLYHELRITNP